MLKIILDTNVLVSALIQKSFPYFILSHLYFERKFKLCLSEELIAEYKGVLQRDKFKRFEDFTIMAAYVLNDIERHAQFYVPKNRLTVINDDADNRLLELARECAADYLITGNTNDFTMKEYHSTKIISPRAFWELQQ